MKKSFVAAPERGAALVEPKSGKFFETRNLMEKKPPELKLIDKSSMVNPLAPPATLGTSGTQLWNAIHADFVVTDSAGLQMLFQICSASDDIAAYSATIAKDGATVRTKAGVKVHPLLRNLLSTRSFVVRSLHQLGLDVIPPRPDVGRPPGS